MSDKKNNKKETPAKAPAEALTEAQENKKTVSLQTIYIKDISFEAPNSPDVFLEKEVAPDTKLNIANSHAKLGDGVYDVSLKVTVESTYGDKTLFVAEVEQAGVFAINGYSEEEIRALIAVFCPNTLFPFIRELVSGIVTKAGFPALLLQPINFDSIYSQAIEQQKDQKPN
jgi:preprotein translocase subunit SecB